MDIRHLTYFLEVARLKASQSRSVIIHISADDFQMIKTLKKSWASSCLPARPADRAD
ncbi:hypothetical protein PO124_04635 [Bacillus licheniformis]|nr:hypothetical protein [Bacillus licheniformis]